MASASATATTAAAMSAAVMTTGAAALSPMPDAEALCRSIFQGWSCAAVISCQPEQLQHIAMLQVDGSSQLVCQTI